MDVPSIDVSELLAMGNEESSADVRARVTAARRRLRLAAVTRLSAEAEVTLAKAATQMALSPRGIARCLAVARTIACLANSDETDLAHVREASQYRVPAGDEAANLREDTLAKSARVA